MIKKLVSRVILLGIVTAALQSPALAQGKRYGYLNQANLLFRHGEYASAAQYYEKFLSAEVPGKAKATAASPAINQPGPTSPHLGPLTSQPNPFAIRKQPTAARRNWRSMPEIRFHLAECYRLCHDYARAEAAYAIAADSCSPPDPLAGYWYGVALRANGKYLRAMEALTRFEQHYDHMDAYLTGADLELRNLRFIAAEGRLGVKDSFALRRQDFPGMNSAYAATEWGEDSIVFTGIAGGGTAGQGRTGAYTNRLYQVAMTGTAAGTPRELALDPEQSMHDGMASFSADRQRIYFTRWSEAGGIRLASIYESHRTDTGWTEPAKMELVNTPGYSSAQPFVVESPDGYYLLFSSNRPEGVGNYDLWTAYLDSAYQVLHVANMGNTINTQGDDISPYFHKNTRTLIFSTNGRPGVGGFDICSAAGNIGLLAWERPENAGLALNSPRDDLYFLSSDTVNCWNTGWLSSDRESDCCLALYSFRQINEQVVMGRVVECATGRPLPGVQLTLEPGGKKAAIESATGSDGRYRFQLHNTSSIRLFARLTGYSDTAIRLTLKFRSALDTFLVSDLCLSVPVVTPQPEADPSDHLVGVFGYRAHTLSPECKSRLDSIAATMAANPALVLELNGYTDGRGGDSYNLLLANHRVQACIDYLAGKGVAKSRLVGKAMGKCCPLIAEKVDGKDDPVARQRNRRVEYKFL